MKQIGVQANKQAIYIASKSTHESRAVYVTKQLRA